MVASRSISAIDRTPGTQSAADNQEFLILFRELYAEFACRNRVGGISHDGRPLEQIVQAFEFRTFKSKTGNAVFGNSQFSAEFAGFLSQFAHFRYGQSSVMRNNHSFRAGNQSIHLAEEFSFFFAIHLLVSKI